MLLDAVTVRNLELIEPLFAGTDAGVTLFRSIDCAVTPMGKRLLREWFAHNSAAILPEQLASWIAAPRSTAGRALPAPAAAPGRHQILIATKSVCGADPVRAFFIGRLASNKMSSEECRHG